MNMKSELVKLEQDLMKATEQVYLLKIRPNEKNRLRDIILKAKEALAIAENLEDRIYMENLDD